MTMSANYAHWSHKKEYKNVCKLYVWLLQYISVMTSLIKTLWIIPDFLFQCKGDYLIRFCKCILKKFLLSMQLIFVLKICIRFFQKLVRSVTGIVVGEACQLVHIIILSHWPSLATICPKVFIQWELHLITHDKLKQKIEGLLTLYVRSDCQH